MTISKWRMWVNTACCLFLCTGLLLGQGEEFYDSPTADTDDDDLQELSRTNPFAKGNFMIGTGFGFSTAKSQVDISGSGTNFEGESGTSTQLNFSPGVGYFFTKNFAFGIAMNYLSSNSEVPTDFDDPASVKRESFNRDILFGPFTRLYVPIQEDKAFFVSATLGFGNSRDEFNTGENSQTVNTNLITFGVGPGLTIIAADGLAIESIIRYNYSNSDSEVEVNEVTRTTNTTTNAFDFSVGIRYYFSGFNTIE